MRICKCKCYFNSIIEIETEIHHQYTLYSSSIIYIYIYTHTHTLHKISEYFYHYWNIASISSLFIASITQKNENILHRQTSIHAHISGNVQFFSNFFLFGSWLSSHQTDFNIIFYLYTLSEKLLVCVWYFLYTYHFVGADFSFNGVWAAIVSWCNDFHLSSSMHCCKLWFFFLTLECWLSWPLSSSFPWFSPPKEH